MNTDVCLLVHLPEFHIQRLQLVEELTLISPHVQLANQFWNNQKRTPTPNFFALQDIAENVISNVQNVLAFGTDKFGENVAWPTGVNVIGLERTGVHAYSQTTGVGVHLSEDGTFAEE